MHLLFFSFRPCYVLAYGVYLESFLKDMVCSPRPYAPLAMQLCKKQSILSSIPRLIHGLVVGNHHLEHILSSTHSVYCMSMALFLGTHLHNLYHAGSLSTAALATWVTVYCVDLVCISPDLAACQPLTVVATSPLCRAKHCVHMYRYTGCCNMG